MIAETFTTAWRRLADVPAGEEARLWLYGTARRTLANHRRSALRRTALARRLREEHSAYADPATDRAPEGAREAFSRLSDDDRELLSLVGWEGLGTTEIAKVLGCSHMAVRQRLHRARKRLAAELAADDIDLSTYGRRAAPEVYESQLRGAGIDVSLRVVPATPSFVGEIATDTPGWRSGPFPYADKIKTIDRPGGCGLGRTCPIGLTIAKDFTGSADITLGRAARPGEEYEIVGMLHAPKEPLHCAPFYNRRVSEVRESLARLGLAISGFAVRKSGDRGADAELRTTVPDSMYVHGGGLSEYGKADLVVSETPMPDTLVRTILQKEGCPADGEPTS